MYQRQPVDSSFDVHVCAHACWQNQIITEQVCFSQWCPPLSLHPLYTHTYTHMLPLAALRVDWLLVTSSQLAQKQAPWKVWLHCLYLMRWRGSEGAEDREEKQSRFSPPPPPPPTPLRKGFAHWQSKSQGRAPSQGVITEVHSHTHIHTTQPRVLARRKRKGRFLCVIVELTIRSVYCTALPIKSSQENIDV